jgi:phosphonate transport system substrate-binding protein
MGRSSANIVDEVTKIEPIAQILLENLKKYGYEKYQIYSDGENDLNLFSETVNNENIDIVFESMYPSAKLTKTTKLEPQLMVKRNGDLYYSSYIFTRKTSGINRLEDIGGNVIAFEDKYSTSSRFLPAKEIKAAGFKLRPYSGNNIPKDTVEFIYTNSESKIANYVYLKKIKIGALSSADWTGEGKVPEFMKETFKILHKTESIPRMFTLVRADLDENVKEQIIKDLMEIHKTPKGRKALKNYQITRFHKIGFDWRKFFGIFCE